MGGIIVYAIFFMLISMLIGISTWDYINIRKHKIEDDKYVTFRFYMSIWEKLAHLYKREKTGDKDVNLLAPWESPGLLKKGKQRIILGWLLIIPLISGVFFLIIKNDNKNIENSIPKLIQSFANENSKANAVDELTNIGSYAIEPLIEVLDDENVDIREGAAEALSKIMVQSGWDVDDSDDSMVDSMIPALNDESPIVRKWIASTLGYTKNEHAVEPLIVLLNDADQDVRVNAAHALVSIGDERAVEPLMKALENKDLAVIAHESAFFVSRGVAGTENIFIEALNLYGTKYTANDYLNCGNIQLEDAAQAWAELHGYEIGGALDTQNIVTWGSK